MTGIYEIVHLASGRAYIGSSDNVPRRLKAHRGLLRRGVHENVRLQRAWLRDGEAAFAFQVFEECPIDRLRDREAELVGSRSLVYNTSPVVRPGAPAANSSVVDEVVRAIYGRAAAGEPVADLAREFGVAKHTAIRIAGGRTYRRLTGGRPARAPIRAIGSRVGPSKLNADAVRAIRARYRGEYGQKSQLAREYGVSHRTVHLVLIGETWGHVH